MSRVYWDTMLFIYSIEGTEGYADQVRQLYSRMLDRGDRLFTSVFTLGETLVGPERTGNRPVYDAINEWLTGRDVDLIPWDAGVAYQYAAIRAANRVKPPDAIHLASAASANTDLFITNDQALRRLTIDGIKFIDDLRTTVLGAE